MRSLVVLLLGVRVVAAQVVVAPGLDDALPDQPWDVTRKWSTSVAFGVASPWGDLPVRTDWIRTAWAWRPVASSLVFARTRAGSTERSVVAVGLALRGARFAVRVHGRRVDTTVTGYAKRARSTFGLAGRVELPRGTLGYVVAIERAAPRWRSRWSWADAHRSVRWIVTRADRRFEPSAAWSAGVFVALTSAAEIGVGVQPHDTIWSLAVRRRPWRLRVGAVVDGPRAGATAVAVEWTR